jgi:hypothetical protein
MKGLTFDMNERSIMSRRRSDGAASRQRPKRPDLFIGGDKDMKTPVAHGRGSAGCAKLAAGECA